MIVLNTFLGDNIVHMGRTTAPRKKNGALICSHVVKRGISIRIMLLLLGIQPTNLNK